MASDPQTNQANPSPRRPRRAPIAGLAVLAVVGAAVALPMVMDSGCSPLKSAPAASTEPMELWGRWLGMMLASADSATARGLGVPPVMTGVVVADLTRDGPSRVAQAGVVPGDVIVKVDGTATGNLAELYTLTTRLNTARSLPLEIVRQGQPVMVMLPPPMEAAPQAPMATAPSSPVAWATPAQMATAPTQAAPTQAAALQPPQLAPQPPALQPAAPQPTLPQPVAPQATAVVTPPRPITAPVAATPLMPSTNGVAGIVGR